MGMEPTWLKDAVKRIVHTVFIVVLGSGIVHRERCSPDVTAVVGRMKGRWGGWEQPPS